MPIFNFIRAEKNTKQERVILWHTGNYKYQIERRKDNKVLSRTNYVNTSFEQVSEIFERVIK